jgi:hypothetical protein
MNAQEMLEYAKRYRQLWAEHDLDALELLGVITAVITNASLWQGVGRRRNIRANGQINPPEAGSGYKAVAGVGAAGSAPCFAAG